MEAPAVKLTIKAPNQQIKDQIVKCDIGWTVGRLKEYLSEVYPSKPERSSQKLIYSGQLLSDTTYLKDVLRQCEGLEDQSYTVHLVCTQKPCVNRNAEHTRVTENSAFTARSGNDMERPNETQNQSQDNGVVNQPPPTQLYSMHQYIDPNNSQQIAWMQQAYTHYMTQYMQLMAAQGIPVQSSIPYVQQLNINTNDTAYNTYITNNNNNNNNAAEEQPQQAAADAADVIGNNNIVGEDGAAFNVDWLDFFYMLSRIIILASIVYFYSSPLRFLIVTFLGFAIYLYQGGFFRIQPIVLPENNNARADNNNQGQNEAGGQQAGAQAQNDQGPVQGEGRTNANEEHEAERPGALAFTWTFFSSFFASLIPDQPNVI